MRNSSLLATLALLLATCLPITACAQSSYGDAERKERIIANIKHSIAQLADAPLTVTSIDLGTGTFDKGVLNIAGQQDVSFLVSKDDKELYLLATEAIDASRSGDELAALKEEAERAEGAAAVERGKMLLEASAGLPVRGNPDAAITIVEFSDFQCPYCARATQTVDQVLEEYGDEVRLVYMHLPLDSIHPWATDAAIASSCAASLDDAAFWTLHDYYFENQGDLELANLSSKSAAALAGTEIDMSAYNSCVETGSKRDEVLEHQKLGQSLGLTGTPAFFVNGRMINGAQPIDDFRDAIRLAKADMDG